MRLPATPGWVLLPVVVGVPRHFWLRAPGAVPRHSWLGSTGGGGVWLLAIPGCESWLRFPATPGWGPPAAAVAVSVGLGGGFLVVCVFVARRVCAWCLCWCVCRVFVTVAWLWVCPPCVLVCVRVCASVACGGWFPRLGLAAGVGVGAAGVCCGWSLATPGGGSWVRFPATPGWVPLPVVVGAPRHSWLRAPGAVPRHSWLGGPLVAVVVGPLPLLAVGLGCGSAPLLAGVRRLRLWLFPCSWVWGFSWCVCLWRGAFARGVCAGVCVVCSWRWLGCGCVLCVCGCVCVCVRVWCVPLGFLGWGLPLVWVSVRPVYVVVGPSQILAEVPGCVSPPFLVGFRCWWWWVLLATPG